MCGELSRASRCPTSRHYRLLVLIEDLRGMIYAEQPFYVLTGRFVWFRILRHAYFESNDAANTFAGWSAGKSSNQNGSPASRPASSLGFTVSRR